MPPETPEEARDRQITALATKQRSLYAEKAELRKELEEARALLAQAADTITVLRAVADYGRGQ